MNPLILHELAQIEEQERMNAALRRAALRAARREAGLSWMQAVRGRLLGRTRHAPIGSGAVSLRPRLRVAGAPAEAEATADC